MKTKGQAPAGKSVASSNGEISEAALPEESCEQKPAPAPPPQYYASLYPGPMTPLPLKFVASVAQLEKLLGVPVWLIIQNNDGPWSEIGGELFKGFQRSINEMPAGKPMALLLESPGGDAHFAYRIAKMLQERSANQLTVIVPQYAKSAGTLLALGAADLILGEGAELGPLDVQMFDREREAYGSALDAVQSLERLNAFAMTAMDQTMLLLVRRTAKRTDIILPHVLNYVSQFLNPLLQKIDTLDYTKKSRELKVAEEYAVRLMRPNYLWGDAKRIARQLVERYPTHGFVINKEEAEAFENVGSGGESFGLGLNLCEKFSNNEEMNAILRAMVPFLDSLVVAGRLRKVEAS